MKVFNINRAFLFLTILLLIDCSLGGFIAYWRNPFWTSVEHRDLYNFIRYLGEFSLVALTSCFVSGYSSYLCSIISLAIRTKLTRKALTLASHVAIEGGAQRVQEDCFAYPTLMISLVGGLLRSCVMIVVFLFILLAQVPWYYTLIPILYALIGTGLAGKIAHPLIGLNYVNQCAEAAFRHYLTKSNYNKTHRNNFELFKRTKYLSYFQSFFNQITIIVPYIILSGLYFSVKITFGVFMQVASSMAGLIDNFSYVINSFNDLNRFLSCRKRLKEINII